MQHGLFSDGTFFMIAQEKSLAYKLAMAGYDVWIGNNRGTPYSRGHQTLDPETDAEKYYDYSFYELGQYDMPAMVDHILAETGRDKIDFIGHSQGSTQMFSALAENHGGLNGKIAKFVALSPTVDLRHTHNEGVQQAAEQWKQIKRLTYWFGLEYVNFPPDGE